MKKETHAWFSQKQFESSLLISQNTDEKNNPYIYYYDSKGEIIQITEVTSTTNKYPSSFDDVVYLGTVSKFHSSSTETLKISKHNNSDNRSQ